MGECQLAGVTIHHHLGNSNLHCEVEENFNILLAAQRSFSLVCVVSDLVTVEPVLRLLIGGGH